MHIFLKKYPHLLFITLIFVLTLIHLYQRNSLVYTGDEPRFVYYAYSINKGQMLKYPLERFVAETRSVLPAHSVQPQPLTLNIYNKTMFMMNSIVAPLMYSPALLLGKAYKCWELLRTAAFFYYCFALGFIWLSLRQLFSIKDSFLALSITCLSVPQLAQMSLGNTEQIAILFIAIAIYFLLIRSINITSILIGGFSLSLIVWSSMRCAPIACALGAGFLVRLSLFSTLSKIYFHRYFLLFIICTCIGILGWIILQISFTGTIKGSSLLNETLSDKPLLWFFQRSLVPIFNHKDGIFLLFPVTLFSLLGLINATLHKNLYALIFLVAWIAYFFLISLTSQSEGYPGRLQFVLVEFIIFGLAFYLRDFNNFVSRLALILALIFSFIVTYNHLLNPTGLVLNREFGLFQQLILASTKSIDFGRYVIWDKHSVWVMPEMPLYLSDMWMRAFKVFGWLISVSVFLLLSISKKFQFNMRKVFSLAAISLVVYGIFTLFVVPISHHNYTITKKSFNDNSVLIFTFKKPIDKDVTITFGPITSWQGPDFPLYFLIRSQGIDGSTKQYEKRSMPEIRLFGLKSVKTISIEGVNTNSEWAKYPVNVYTSLI